MTSGIISAKEHNELMKKKKKKEQEEKRPSGIVGTEGLNFVAKQILAPTKKSVDEFISNSALPFKGEGTKEKSYGQQVEEYAKEKGIAYDPTDPYMRPTAASTYKKQQEDKQKNEYKTNKLPGSNPVGVSSSAEWTNFVKNDSTKVKDEKQKFANEVETTDAYKKFKEQRSEEIRKYQEAHKDETLFGTLLNTGVQLGTGVVKFGEKAIDTAVDWGTDPKRNPFINIMDPDLSWKEKAINTGKQALGTISKVNSLLPGNPLKNTVLNKASEKAYDSIKVSDWGKSVDDEAQRFIKKDLTASLKDKLGYNKDIGGKTIQETLDQNSAIKSKNKGGQFVENIGEQLPTMLLGAAGGNAVSTAALGASAYGGSVEKAYKEGATRDEARKYAAISAATEIATEKMFAGIGGVVGKGALDDVVKEKIKGKIKDGVTSYIVGLGLDALGEGLEEVASDIMQPIALKLTYMKDADIKKLYKDQDYFEDFLMGALSSLAMSVPTQTITGQASAEINTKNRYNDTLNSVLAEAANKKGTELTKTEKKNIENSFKEQYDEAIKQAQTTKSGNINVDYEKVLENSGVLNEVQNNNVNVQEIQELTENNMKERKDNKDIKMMPTDEIAKLNEGGGKRSTSEVELLKKAIESNGIIQPIFISSETGKIVDGSHRLQIAQELGLENVPVKYINSSKEVDLDNRTWYSLVEEKANNGGKENTRIEKIDERMQDEQRNNKRGIISAENRKRNTNDNRLYQQVQRNNNRSSVETVYDGNTSVGQELNNSSFSYNENNQQTNKLTKAELEELNDLKMMNETFELSDKEAKRMEYLEKKQQGYIERYLGLKKISDFKDISEEYRKYKNLDDFDRKLLKEAESVITGYRDTGRRTKTEWLEIAKYIGNNFKDSSSENLTKYAVQSWFDAQPNNKSTLNRQGKKYVEFGIKDWVNAVYDGARVGELEKANIPIKETKPKIPTKTDIETESKKDKTVSIPLAKKDNVLRVKANNIAKQINETGGFDLKERSWARTSTESDVLKDSVYIEDLDPKKISYTVKTNKKSLENANNKIKNLGYEGALNHAKELMNSDKLPSASEVALIERMIQEASKRGDVETAQNLIMDAAILGTDLGQATQALSIIQKLTPEGQLKLYTKMVQRAKVRGEKSFQNVEITPEMVQKVLEAYKADGTFDQNDLNSRVESFKQDIANQMKTTVGEKVDAWRYLSMLGNPKTHIRNMVSNVAMKGTIKAKNAVARTLESILPVKERTKTWKKASNEIKNYAAETANEMKGVITGENKYNEKASIESKKQIFKNKTLEKISNFNSNALEAEDWFFSKSAFKNTLQEYLTANNITTMEDIKNNPELVEKAKLYAVEQAEIATFRQYSKLASMINQFERKSKVGKFAIEATVPFKKTPINVAKAGVNYSPLGLIKNITYDAYQLKKGNINASQFIDNISQGMTGTSLTLLGYALAKAGILSGSGDDDKEGKYDSQLGKTGYSVNLGGKSYSISWLSPVAMPLLVGSNAYEQLEEQKDWDMNVVSDSLAKTLDPLNEMSFMQGLTNALQSYGGGADKIKGSLESVAQNYTGQFFPTLFSQIASVGDDTKRSTQAGNSSSYKFGEQTVRGIMYKIPGLRNQLEASTDIWGNEKKQADNILQRAFESFIAPYSSTKDVSTELDNELKRVYKETGETKVIPGIPKAYLKYKDETYRMSAKEYTEYKKTYGKKANEYLNALIDTNSYKNASDDEKADMINNIYKFAGAEANEKYFNSNDIDYTNNTVKELNQLKNIGIDNKSLAEYVSGKAKVSAIRNNDQYTTEQKRKQAMNVFINSNLNNKQLSYLYGKFYSSEKTLNNVLNAGIPMKEFIKFDSQDFDGEFDESTGRTKTNSKKYETLQYIQSLKLSAVQKALLAKSKYSSYTAYDNQIAQYIQSRNLSLLDKYKLVKYAGLKSYDRQIVNYVSGLNKTADEKEKLFKDMGFTTHNGRVYVK